MARKDQHTLQSKIRSLDEAVGLCEGRIDAAVINDARQVIERADQRMALSGDSTVVALAGATGSGKSSTFNALSGTDLAVVGVRRPTTSQAFAVTWGEDSAEELLDWLKIPRRHAINSDSALDGLVLLDLPDHDSTERAHRVEVDRLVQLVDMLIWVVDPQKYADAALHDRYLKPLAKHAEVMMVILNQSDRLSAEERQRCLKDLRRLLDSEGLGKVEVMATSAATGDGIDVLIKKLARQVSDKKAAGRRLAADLGVAAGRVAEASGGGKAPGLTKASVDRLDSSLGQAAGIPIVVDAVGKAWRIRGGVATGWPVLSWMAKLRPDPLRRLHLDRLGVGKKRKEIEPTRVGRTSLPATSMVQRAGVDSALRALADAAGQGLSRGWVDAIKVASRSQADTLADRLDRAVATTDLEMNKHRRWWAVVRVLQWLLVATVVAGLLWLSSGFVLAYFQLPPLPRVTWWQIPAPTFLVGGGVLAGLLLAGASRIGVEIGARRRSAKARSALQASISKVTREAVTAPVKAELERYERASAALERARATR